MADAVMKHGATRSMNEKNTRSTTHSTRKTKSRINKPSRLIHDLQCKVATKKFSDGIIESYREDMKESQLCSAFFKPENKEKNLRQDVFLYDGTRVILDSGASDYYHASWVDGAHRERQYILAQAPMKNTLDDFNRLIEQTKPAAMVFLQGCESDEAKLFLTTPRIEKTDGWELYTYGQKHKIKVFSFTGWTVDSKPPKNFLLTLEKFRKMIAYETKAPLMIVCKTGAARCGTFALVDEEMERAKTKQRIRLIETIKTLRLQRGGVLETFEIFDAAINLIVKVAKKFSS